MGAPRGDAAGTQQVVLAAARELFAAHGVDVDHVAPARVLGGARRGLDQDGGPEE